MGIEGLVEAASAAAVAAVTVGETSRRYWSRREVRQQDAFRRAVQAIVDESMAAMLRRQAEFERRQGQHLDRQDVAIAEIRRVVEQRRR